MNTNGSRQGEASNSRTPDRFCASEKQLAYLTVCQDAEYGIEVKEACTAAGIGRQTYYDWVKNSDFNRWWLQCIEQHFLTRLPGIYAELFNIVHRGAGVGAPGKVGAAKLLFERFDQRYRPKEAVEHTVTLGIDEYLKAAARKQLEAEDEAQAVTRAREAPTEPTPTGAEGDGKTTKRIARAEG